MSALPTRQQARGDLGAVHGQEQGEGQVQTRGTLVAASKRQGHVRGTSGEGQVQASQVITRGMRGGMTYSLAR